MTALEHAFRQLGVDSASSASCGDWLLPSLAVGQVKIDADCDQGRSPARSGINGQEPPTLQRFRDELLAVLKAVHDTRSE
jgi:hypothetical protein